MRVAEQCSCGAAIDVRGLRALRTALAWRAYHTCPDRPEPEPEGQGASAHIERAPDFTVPELHIGFRAE